MVVRVTSVVVVCSGERVVVDEVTDAGGGVVEGSGTVVVVTSTTFSNASAGTTISVADSGLSTTIDLLAPSTSLPEHDASQTMSNGATTATRRFDNDIPPQVLSETVAKTTPCPTIRTLSDPEQQPATRLT